MGDHGTHTSGVAEPLIDDELLSTLVGKVDAELFKGIVFEVLKSKLIEDTNKIGKLPIAYAELGVDGLDNPCKENAVKGAGERVSLLGGASRVEKHGAKLLADQLELVGE